MHSPTSRPHSPTNSPPSNLPTTPPTCPPWRPSPKLRNNNRSYEPPSPPRNNALPSPPTLHPRPLLQHHRRIHRTLLTLPAHHATIATKDNVINDTTPADKTQTPPPTPPRHPRRHPQAYHLHLPQTTAPVPLPTPINTTTTGIIVSHADTTSPPGIRAPPATTASATIKWDARDKMWRNMKRPATSAPKLGSTKTSFPRTPLQTKPDG